jgi:3-hydroxy-9,10-secoandrosta-1,3,5(10)-triene-9,17-dione monooxygenase reductase component
VGLDDGFHRIGSDPYAVPEGDKDRTRRLRGQMPAPVTIWTAYDPAGTLSGITVSSVLIAEGKSPSVLGLIAPLSEFWDAVRVSKRFVVHLLGADQTRAADQFALRYPVNPFDGLSVSQSDYGPVIDGVATWALATLTDYFEAGYSLLVRGSIDHYELAVDPPRPLIQYRGRYLTAASRNE